LSKKNNIIRLFTGISLPLDLRQQLRLLQEDLAGARLTALGNYHITLTFIGNVEIAAAQEINEVLSGLRVPPFSLRVRGTGYFDGNHHAGHLWMGVEHSEPLRRLKEKIDRALEANELPFEKRNRYMPHVTIASLKQGDEALAAAFMQRHNLFASDPFEVGEFILYRSHPDQDGAVYEELAGYPLY
jgi:2'-5' RNA ligase